MKIRKVDEKPMVIHRKKKPKLHLQKGGKAVLHKKAESKVSISGRKAGENGRKKAAEKSGEKAWKEGADSSIKVKKQSLRVFASASVRHGVKQVESGEEIAESMDVMDAVTAPAVGMSDRAGTLYRRKKAERKKQRKKNRMREEGADAVDSLHIRKQRVKNKKEKSGRKDSGNRKGGEKGGSASSSFVKSRMLESFLDKLQTEKEDGQGGLVEGTAKTAKAAALLLAKKAVVLMAPIFLVLFAVIAIVGLIVVAILAVIYNSPLAIFFPQPDTGYENPRTVLCEYYKEFNQSIIQLENDGCLVTYQNSEDGAPVSNFNDTLMVYMVKYGVGQAAYVMDGEGKKHLKEVFDEMNYCDNSSSKTQIPAGKSLGEVVTTGYCNCSLCCGKWAGGHTASGTVVE